MNDFPVLGIGTSAGGLDALRELFEHLPTHKFSCVVVQHLAPAHESLLAELLSRQTKMTVVEATEGAKLTVDCVYTIPPDTAITVGPDETLHLSPRKDVTGLFLPVDCFFHSLANALQARAIGVILSGGGSDGSQGIQEIKDKGGTVFAQHESSAKFPSMPHNAIATGVVDFILPPKEIAEQLSRLFKQNYWSGGRSPVVNHIDQNELHRILKFLHRNSGIDFTSYKVPTLSRRVLRRMAFRGVDTPEKYMELLKTEEAEVKALCQDILILVTSFFRDPECFEGLRTTIFPRLLSERGPQESLRIWVPGCASGEEAYSILMALTESLTGRETFPVQVFGTDINEAAVDKARTGRYVENSVAEVSEERRRRFFQFDGNRYHINKTLRDQCIFAKHNLVTDPPFAKLDLISCQNLLIYFDASLQKRVMSIFHYALKPTGILVLGRAETAGAHPELFSLLKGGGGHAYVKVPTQSRLYFDFAGAQQAGERIGGALATAESDISGIPMTVGLQVQREADRLLIGEFAPPGVIFNNRLEVIQFKGQTGPYFEHSPGFASLELLKMLRGGLIADVRAAIERVRDKGERVRNENIKLRTDDGVKRIAFELFPMKLNSREPYFLLTFEDMDLPSIAEMNKRRAAKRELLDQLPPGEELTALRAELSSTRDYLQSSNEEKEAANEELMVANEEVMSSNEELQSTNEELHTAKEELQSTNEELQTVNDELQTRNRELAQANNDLSNLFSKLSLAVVMLGKELRIRKFTKEAEKLLGLVPSDMGRSITDLRAKLDIPNLKGILNKVIDDALPTSFDVQDQDGKWYSVTARPYRTDDDKIDGVIIQFMDINETKMSLEYAQAIEETIGEPILLLSADFKVKKANAKFLQVFGTTLKATEGESIYDLGDGAWNIPALKVLLEEVLPKNTSFRDFEFKHEFPGLGSALARVSGRRLFHHHKHTEMILLVFSLLPAKP